MKNEYVAFETRQSTIVSIKKMMEITARSTITHFANTIQHTSAIKLTNKEIKQRSTTYLKKKRIHTLTKISSPFLVLQLVISLMKCILIVPGKNMSVCLSLCPLCLSDCVSRAVY